MIVEYGLGFCFSRFDYYYEHGIAIGVVVWKYGLVYEIVSFVLRLFEIHTLYCTCIGRRAFDVRLVSRA
jgi:hypothetical protein